MTEVRQNSSSLVLSEAYDGRFLVLNSRRQLVAELHKPAGRKVELGLEPGEYDVFFEQAKQLLTTSVHLAEGQRQELVRETLKPTERRPSQSRGPEPGGAAKPDLLDGRIRVQVAWLGRFAVAHWLRPDVALQLSVQNNTFGGAERTFLLGGRYYPHLSGRLRPFVGASVGSVAVPQSRSSWTPEGGFQYEYLGTRNSLGSALEAGADIYIGRNFSVSLSGQGGYAGGWTNFNTWLSLGWTFGGSKKKD
jgi:hypothetical protein